MCLCTQSCTSLTKQEKKAIIDAEKVVDDVFDIEPGCNMSGCESGSCGKDKGRGRSGKGIPLNIANDFKPGSK
jgi:hypothetical protein